MNQTMAGYVWFLNQSQSVEWTFLFAALWNDKNQDYEIKVDQAFFHGSTFFATALWNNKNQNYEIKVEQSFSMDKQFSPPHFEMTKSK